MIIWRTVCGLWLLCWVFCGGSGAAAAAAAAAGDPVLIPLGQAVAALNGPWKFHTGDDPNWAAPDFDDSAWETVDLSPPPGAHDSDVGLTGYVPGWQARGHPGYFGYAWYRIRVLISSPPGEFLALDGPAYLDSAYQVFLNGRRLGEVGDFSGRTPAAYGIHSPTMFLLPDNQGSVLLALRVWAGPWTLRDPEAGGIHIAPALGTASGAKARYQLQWLETIRGYIVDAVEALLFALLAVIAYSLIAFDRSDPAYRWLAGALILVGLVRANQAVMFWWQFETFHGFELVTIVLLVPLSLGAWTLAWYTWFRLRGAAWVPAAAAGLTLLYMSLECLRRSWFYGAFPDWFNASTRVGSTSVRVLFFLLMLFIAIRGLSEQRHERWFALPAILSISVGLFAQELSLLHVPGIWFPFGTGVSRTEYAYAAFVAFLFALLLRRLYGWRMDGELTSARSSVQY
jgi:hypothetical protein